MLTRPMSLAALAASLRTGERDLIGYVDEMCERIAITEPHVRALLPEPDRRARLLREATALAARFPHPSDRPPLYGVLVGVKDLFRVDGFPTRAGSRLPAELFDGPEASFVTRLRSAGALILGKTATDELAYCEPAPTRNPHNLDHTPGGSSSGSAAAVASGICPLALGTQTTRSIIGPAAFCGVVGFKPSYGRTPIDGVVPMSESIDTVGLLTADVPSMTLAASVLIDPWRPPAPLPRPVLGVPDGLVLTYMFPETREAFEAQLLQLQQAGYQVKRVPFLDDTQVDQAYRHAETLLHAEMAAVHATWFAHYEPLYRPRTANAIRRGQATPDADAAIARDGRLPFRHAVEDLMLRTGVNLWVLPASAGGAPKGLETTGWGGMTTPWSYAGLPAITVPAGRDEHGLPLGLQAIPAFSADEHLLTWAHDLAAVVRDGAR